MKNEIIQTSLQQFMKYGIRKITMKKLIEPLGISTKTVYKYFKNKEQLLEEILGFLYSQQSVDSVLSVYKTPVEQLYFTFYKGIESEYKINKTFFFDLHHYYPVLNEKVIEKNSKKLILSFIQIIKKGIEEDFFRNDMIPEVIIESITVLYKSITKTDLLKKFRLSQHDMMKNTIGVIIRGMCTAKGNKHLTKHLLSYTDVTK